LKQTAAAEIVTLMVQELENLAIIGAGIGGLASAIALSRFRDSVQVCGYSNVLLAWLKRAQASGSHPMVCGC
jgi:2-polyprenyl-6-methoxyphenol hydroxylase-like FAD-dependent oxidoreductase